jgi:hypothetical protein
VPSASATPYSPVGVSARWLVDAIQDVRAETPEYDLKDSTGVSMQTLKVVPYASGYLGVYHCWRHHRFEVRVATSTDLRTWVPQTVLDSHASQPTLSSTPRGGFVLAVEADNDANPGPGRRFLRFKYYTNVGQLLAGNAARTFVAQHTLAPADHGAEGTPNIDSIVMGADIRHSRIDVGFHYLTGGVDRQARGTLTDFSVWETHRATSFDRALLAIGARGKHGDRDAIHVSGTTLDVVEYQTGSDPYWHLALYDPGRGVAQRLTPYTSGDSRSFANPTVTFARLPDGRPGVVMTAFLPRTGAAVGENGEVLYSRALASAADATADPTGHS